MLHVVLALLFGPAVHAAHAPVVAVRLGQSTPAIDTTRVLLLHSADAVGGLVRLRAIRGVSVTEVGHEYLVTTRTRADLPTRLISQTMSTWRSQLDSAFRRTTTQLFPMRATAMTSTTIANRGAVVSTNGGSVTPGGTFDVALAKEELALSPERVLLTALDATPRRLGLDTTIAGAHYHTVEFEFGDGRARLFLDAQSGFPNRLELIRAYPTMVFWAMWGDLRFTTIWSAWALEPSGVWYPRQRTVSLNETPFREYAVSSVEFPPSIPADSVAIPDSLRALVMRRTETERTPGGAQLTPVAVDTGLVLYQGGYQSMAVRQHDGIVVIEAPESESKSRAVLADVAARFGPLRVKAVVTTSPMWSHIGGLREYIARGIPVYVLDANASIVAALASAPHRLAPDSLARRPRDAVLRVVRGLTTVGAGDERIELRPARGQHAADMMLVYFPSRHMLYASDVLTPSTFEPVFTAAYRAELMSIVAQQGVAVSRFLSLHLPLASWPPIATP